MTGIGTGATTGRKRFYEAAGVAPSADAAGYVVTLDGRPLRTPAKRELALPSRALADAVAAEWQAQAATIEPAKMPITRIVNSALDGVADSAAEVRAAILAYGGNDMLCYLAAGPRDLIERQSAAWGPVHGWTKQQLGVELVLATGVMPVVQDPAMLARLDAALGQRGPLELAALHVTTSTMGSLLLSLAVVHRRLTPAEAWATAHVDEDYQIEKWGEDAEATARRRHRWLEVEAACRILGL